jgi:protease II
MARTVHGITWKDDLAWMEDMKSERWKKYIRTQQERWKNAVEPVNQEIPLLVAELEAAKKVSGARLFGNDQIQISHHGTMSYSWSFSDESHIHSAADLDICRKIRNRVWSVQASDDGSEEYSLECLKRGGTSPVWAHRGVGPFVAVVDGRAYSILSKNKLVYYKLVSWDARTGEDYQEHYEEKDYRYNLELIRGSCNSCILRRQAGGKQDCFFVTKKGIESVKGVSLESRRFVFDLANPRNYFYWENNSWKSPGKNLLELPKEEIPDSMNLELGLLVTKWNGRRTLWKGGKKLWEGVGSVFLDPWLGPWVRFTQPGREVVWWRCDMDSRPHHASLWNRSVSIHSVKGVSYVVIEPDEKQKLKGLLITGYGAYGIPSSMNTARWEPLLHRGWCIVIGMWRGGGDHTPEWEDAGRVWGREQVLEDAEAVVRAAQKETGVPASKTVLYGRSAGGLWVGGLVARTPDGSLAGGAYMEVPYLDVLRTTTNHSLPLTLIETDEFGLPSQRVADFASILKWSPMELLEGPVKGVQQIVRTGLNDSEVFAYESAKWVQRCGSEALLAVEGGQGHFVSGAVGLTQQAEDLAVLLSLVGK